MYSLLNLHIILTCVSVSLYLVSYLFYLYRSHSSHDCCVLDSISDNIDKAISLYPFANMCLVILMSSMPGSLNTLSLTLLTSKPLTCQSFTQVVEFSTCFFGNSDGHISLLDLFLLFFFFYLYPRLMIMQ